jgi:SAM-dependent methyltransferase
VSLSSNRTAPGQGGPRRLPRQLERDVIQWDVRSWRRGLRFWRTWLDRLRPANALAIGERGGGLSLWLALHGVRVLCTDLWIREETPALHRRYGVSDRVTYAAQDVTALTLPDGTFDLVIFKSVVGALSTRDRQERAFAEIHRVLRPGGALLFAENLCSTRLHGWLRERFVELDPWRHQWRYLHARHDRDLLAPFAQVELRSSGFLANLGRNEAQRDLLARIDAVLCPIVPRTWHYILFGACLKGGAPEGA